MMASCLPTSSLGLFAPQTPAPLPPGCFSSHVHKVLTRSLLETHRVDQWDGVHSEKGQALRQGTWVKLGRWSGGPGEGALPAGSTAPGTPQPCQSWCLGARGRPLIVTCSLPSRWGKAIPAGPQRSQHQPLPSCVEFLCRWRWHLGHLLQGRRGAEEWAGGETRPEPSA